mmetsp:Transcript_5036/g.7415  ORF Transcript_5036/g.7415 Transcript_5036/m.7415 type:complete len:186 (+) Transcript_5036:3-560(+)
MRSILLLASCSAALLLPGGTPTRRDLGKLAAAAITSAAATAANADDKTVKKFFTTPGGVKYFDLKEGNGYSPNPGQIVVLKYEGYLSNGKKFDSWQAPGKGIFSAKFKASPPQMLPGWEEALETMKEGGTRIIQVPPALAYGDKGLCLAARDDEGNCPEPLLVPPNEKLQFELQLLRVALDPSRL